MREETGDALAQVFSPAADTALRLFVLATALVLGALMLGAWDYSSSAYVTGVGMVQSQPVPFSHQHHVQDVGMDCRYCHTNAESGPNAGLPPTHTCMTCHSQLWTGAEALAPVRASLATGQPLRWQRVSKLPDYVYFDHSIHVSRGVGCVECHGRMDQMPLAWRAEPFQMQFCLDCHRDPAPHLRPRDRVTQMTPLGWSKARQRRFGERAMARHHIDPAKLNDCGVCHR